MATLSGSYIETNVASIANMETLLNAHLALEDTEVGTAVLILGSMAVTMLADNGVGDTHTHKCTQSLNCKDLAASILVIAEFEIYLGSVLTQSAYSTLQMLDIVCTTTMST